MDTTQRLRRFSWMTFAFSAVSLILLSIAKAMGAHVLWMSWVLTFVLSGNAAVFFLKVLKGRPWLERAYLIVSFAAMGIAAVVDIVNIAHRGRLY